jgi:dUTPase
MSHWYELELKLTHPGAQQFYEYNLLNRCSDGAGFDLVCVHPATLRLDQVTRLHLGVAATLSKVTEDGTREPSHFWLVPHASTFEKGVMVMVNVIDRSHRGELTVPVWSLVQNTDLAIGQELFQLVAPDMGWLRHVRVVQNAS